MIPIHTLSIMRNEFRAYKGLIKERNKLIEEYETPLKSLKNELLEVEEKLNQIKSPGKSDGLGGFVQDSVDKYNHLITKKDELKNAVDNYIKEYGNDSFEEELEFWNVRIETVEYYLDHMDALDRKFIEDFYFNLPKHQVMERYNITNIKSLYRKADNILKNLLEKQ